MGDEGDAFCFCFYNLKMSADPVLEEFPLEAMEEIDVVAKEWIQEQSDKEVVGLYIASCDINLTGYETCI